jgi:uncharacterized protein
MDFSEAKKYITNRLETELSPNLYYHGIHHTIDVYEASIKIGELENLSQEEKIIINTSALYHDAGYIFQYKNNEVLAVELINEILPKFAYNEKQIKTIGDIILATHLKAKPVSLLQKIMCDADYDYLGRTDVDEIATTLHRELNEYGFKYSKERWNEMQIEFLNKHVYYTASSLELRMPKKLAYCEYLKSLR